MKEISESFKESFDYLNKNRHIAVPQIINTILAAVFVLAMIFNVMQDLSLEKIQTNLVILIISVILLGLVSLYLTTLTYSLAIDPRWKKAFRITAGKIMPFFLTGLLLTTIALGIMLIGILPIVISALTKNIYFGMLGVLTGIGSLVIAILFSIRSIYTMPTVFLTNTSPISALKKSFHLSRKGLFLKAFIVFLLVAAMRYLAAVPQQGIYYGSAFFFNPILFLIGGLFLMLLLVFASAIITYTILWKITVTKKIMITSEKVKKNKK